MSMLIESCTITDIPQIQRLYSHGRDLQTAKGSVVWGNVSDNLLEKEASEERLWKLVVGDEIACVWSITFNDPEIWKEKNNDAAIYIHRIATDSKYHGQNLVTRIVEWAKTFAPERGLKYIRLDTVGINEGLIRYYTSCGFSYLGAFPMSYSDNLPSHYGLGVVSLFEIDTKKL